MEPAVKPAVELTQSRVVGVLATSQTLASDSYARLAEKFGGDVEIIPQPCPELVTLVENAALQGAEVEAVIARYVIPLLDRGADTLVLGCTHYPFLQAAIRAVAGPNVRVIDPATAVARELRRRLETDDLLSRKTGMGREQFWTSGNARQLQAILSQLWGREADIHALPSRYAVL
jgi:glutamate racemase